MSEREGNFLWNVGDQKTARDSGIGRGQLGFIGLSQIEEVSIGHLLGTPHPLWQGFSGAVIWEKLHFPLGLHFSEQFSAECRCYFRLGQARKNTDKADL